MFALIFSMQYIPFGEEKKKHNMTKIQGQQEERESLISKKKKFRAN